MEYIAVYSLITFIKRLCGVSILLFLFPAVLAAQGAWERIFTTTQQANLFAAAFLSDSEVAVVGESGVIRTTSDTGTTWNDAVSGRRETLRGIAASAEAGLYIAVGDKGLILRSGDRGETWQQVVSNTGEDLVDITFLSSGHAIAVGRGGVRIVTTDGGKSWRHEIGGEYTQDILAVDAIDSLMAIAVGEGGALLKTVDGGRNWSLLPSVTQQNLRAISVVSAGHWYIGGDSTELYMTLDGGASWQKVLANLSNQFNFNDIHFLSADTGFATGVQYRDLYIEHLTLYTTDGGISWNPNNNGVYIGEQGIASYGSHGMIVGRNGTIIRFSRSSHYKRHVGFNVAYGGSLRYNDIECSDPNNCIAVGEAEVYAFDPTNESAPGSTGYEAIIERSYDRGETWYRQKSGLSRSRSSPGIRLNGIESIDSLRWYVVGDSGTILYTSDGGEHWQRQESGTDNSLQDVRFADSDEGVAVGVRSTILRTLDGGGRWINADGIPMEGFYNVSALKSGEFLVAAVRSFYKIDQSHSQWYSVPVEFEGNIEGMHFLDSTRGWIVGSRKTPQNSGLRRNDYIVRTIDGGRHWDVVLDAEVGPMSRGLISVDFADELNGLATGYDAKVLRSTDGGLSWRQESIPVINTIDNIGAVAFPSQDYALAGTMGGILLRYDEQLPVENIETPLPSKDACGVEVADQPLIINWSRVAEDVRYHLQISAEYQAGFDETSIVLDESFLTDTFHVVPNLPGPARYYWRVKASDGQTGSEWSSVCSFFVGRSSGVERNELGEPVFSRLIVSLHPNPAADLVTVQLTSAQDVTLRIRVNDIHGCMVMPDHEARIGLGTFQHQLDLSSLAPGLYYMEIDTIGEVMYKPFLIFR